MAKPKIDLLPYLPEVLPLVFDWVERHQTIIMGEGRGLNRQETEIARKVGVQHPELVRILVVHQTPQFDHPRLMELSALVEYPTDAWGVTYGYGIYLRQDHAANQNTLAHELRHVAQHEILGGRDQFVEKYCREVAKHGYYDAPLEEDARKWAEPFQETSRWESQDQKSLVAAICSAILIVSGAFVVYKLLSNGEIQV